MIFLLVVCIAGIFLISCVSAGDLNESDVTSLENDIDEMVEIDENISEDTVDFVESEILSENNDNEVIGTTYYPTSFTDLQNAVNNAKEGDTIQVSGTYVFTSTLYTQVSLNFVGKNSATFDGNSNVALFSANIPGVGSYVSFKDITFKNGYSTWSSGGISSGSSHCTVENCKFINNQGPDGGAMNAYLATINGCTFEGNKAYVSNRYGHGGAFSSSSVGFSSYVCEVTNSIFKNNHGSHGGAIYASTCIINGCTFESNTAHGDMWSGGTGGAVYASVLQLDNSNFNKNSASSYGAVYCSLGSGTGSTFTNNVADNVPNAESFITVNSLNLDVGQKGVFNVKLYDFSGPISNKEVKFNFKNGIITRKTDSNGELNYETYFSETNINKGVNSISISFEGDSNYAPVSTRSNVVVKFPSSLTLSNSSIADEEGCIHAYLYDSEGPLANKALSIKIESEGDYKTCSILTDEQGIAVFNVKDHFTDLKKYIVEVNYVGDGYNYGITKNINSVLTKYDSILSVDNVSFNLDDDKFISVKLSNVQGALFDQIITFNINGVEEERTTLPDGTTSRLNINKYFTEVGKYQVGVSFAGNGLNNPSSEIVNVQINSYKGNLTVVQNGKYYNDTFLTFKLVNLKNNEGVSNANISVIFSNGDIINLTTDSMGMAEYKANFSPGTYYLNASVSDENVNVNKIESKDFVINEIIGIIELRQEGVGFNNSTLIAKLYNPNNGDVYRNIKVELEFSTGDVNHTFTNDDGIVVYPITFTPGNYTVLAKVTGNEFIHFNTTFKKDIYIEKSDANLNFTNEIIFAYGGVGYTNVTVVGGSVFEENICVVNHSDIVPSLNGNVISVTGLGIGHYLLNVTVTPDENHLSISKLLNITVVKTASVVSFDDVVFDYGGVGYTDVTVIGGIVLKENITVVESDKAVIDLVGNTISVSNLSVGNYTLRVVTTPDGDHSSVTNYARIRVNKIDSSVSFDDVVFDFGGVGYTDVTVIGCSVFKGNISVVESDKAVIDLVGNTISVSNLGAGNYTLRVVTIPDGNHSSVTKDARIRVNKINSSVSFPDVVFDYGGVGYTTLTVVGGGVKTIEVKNHPYGAVITWDDNFKVTISNLTAGPYTLQVTTDPDSNHTSVVGEGKIIVNKIYSSFTWDNDILFTYGGSGSTKINVTGGRLVESKMKVLNHNAEIKLRGNMVIVSNLDVGNYHLIVPVVPDENHLEWSGEIPITVKSRKDVESQIILGEPIVFYYGGSGYTTVDVIGGTVSESKIKVDGQKAKIKLEGNRIVVSGLKVGSYNLRVTSIPYSGYISVVESLKITVKKIPAKISAKKISVYYKSKDKFKIKLINSKTKMGIGNMVVRMKVYNGKNSKVYKLKTNSKGIIFVASSKFSVGKHKVVLSMSKYGYECKSVTSSVIIKNIPAKIKVNKLSVYYNSKSKFKIKLINSKTKMGIGNMVVKMKLFNGKNSKVYKLKTNSKGVAMFKVSSKMSLGRHKVVLSMSKYGYKCKSVVSSITVKKIILDYDYNWNNAFDGSSVNVYVTNKITHKPMNGVALRLNVYSGNKIIKHYKVVTGNYKNKRGKLHVGFVGYVTNKISEGTHKLVFKPISNKYEGFAEVKDFEIRKGAANTKNGKIEFYISNGKKYNC